MSKPTTGSLAITAWRNDDYFEYPLRVVGLDLSALVLKMEIRASGDTPGAPLVRLDGVAQDQYVAQGLRVAGVSVVDGVEVSDLRIRMDRGSLQELDYQGELGDAATFEYALLIGGRTRLTGPFILPAHAYGSDAAPAARPASYGMAQAPSFPNGGATLTISQDGGATVIIDGADLVSGVAMQAEAAAEQAAADREAVEAISSTSYRAVETYGDREAIPLDKRNNGMRVQVMQAGQDANGYIPRVFEWRTDLFAPGGWTGLLTQAELQRRELQTGKQNQDTINGLPEALSGLDQVTQNVLAGVKRNATLAISTFAALAASAAGPVDLSWAIGGVTPRVQSLSWGGWSIDLDGYARALTLGPWTDRAIIVAGDSVADWLTAAGTWPQKAAATIGQNATPIALYSAGSKQVYRSGAKPLLLTLNGNRLPAGGTAVAVTAINGAAPGGDNPASPLFTYAGDTRALTLTGTIAGRHVTMSATGGGASYALTADAGSTATDVPAGSLFVPDFAQRMGRDELWIMVSHNHFYSEVHPQNINPQALADVDALVRQARGQRICIMGLLPDASWVPGTKQYAAVRAFNAELKRRYPAYYVQDAQGRDPLARMVASGNGSAADNADAANGVTPGSLRNDSLHPNDAGNIVLAALIVEYRALQAQPPAIALGTTFTLSAEGDDGVGGSTQATAVTDARTGTLGAALNAGLTAASDTLKGVVQASADSAAASAARIGAVASTIVPLSAYVTADATGTMRPLQPTQVYYGFIVTRGVWLDTGEIYDPVNDASAALALAKRYVYLPPFADGADVLYPTMLVQGTGQVPAGYSALSGQPFAATPPGAALYDADDLVVVPVSATSIDVYRKGAVSASTRYIRQRFYRWTDAGTTTQGDVWRLGDQWEANRTGAFAFSDVRQIGNDAETDTAIWPNTGATSYANELVGGKEHGGEKTDDAALAPFALADGKPVAFVAGSPFVCRTLEFFQQTSLFLWMLDASGNRTALSGTRLCTINKRHLWSAAEGYRLDLRVTWAAAYNLRQTYLGMGVIYRVNAASEQVTSKAYASPIFAPQDVSAAGYADISSVSAVAKLSGALGITWEWTDLTVGGVKAYSANGRTFFRDTSSRNKFYPTYSGTASVASGAVWDISNRQKLITAN